MVSPAGMLRQLGRILYWLLCCLLALAVALTVVFVVTVRESFPDREGALRVSGLRGDVHVLRDRSGVPQIDASDPADLFFAQGWVHAQDRFWEMDFRRHLSAGRLAELFGKGLVESDSYLRTMGWRHVAAREYELLDQRTKDALTAYSRGVNAYLADHGGSALSLEYGLLRLQGVRYRPARWTPVDSLAWLKVMAWQLRGNDAEEQLRAVLSSRLSAGQVGELFPAYPYTKHRPIVEGGTVDKGVFTGGGERQTHAARVPVPPDVGAVLGNRSARTSLSRAGGALRAISAVAGDSGSGIGSNAWAVSGSRTASGKPILANDPHLGPAMPSIWYQMGLHCAPVTSTCPYDVAGFTFSGFPGVVIGHNNRVSWGFTNLGPDVVDLYLEKVHGDRYEYKGRQLPLATRKEKIRVAGAKSVTITVRSTRHGPLLSDASAELKAVGRDAPVAGGRHPSGARYAVAMRWTALSPGRTADAVLAMDTASDFTEFRSAARRFEVPAQNLVYADVAGHIGYQAPGRVPIRKGYDGRFPAVGWTGKDEWRGYIPFDAMPNELDPREGYVVTANQAAVGPSYPYHLTSDWDYGYRSQRIVDMIEGARAPLTVAGVHRMQLDTRNAAAALIVPYLRRVDAPAGASRAQALFAHWDYSMPAGSAAAAYFNAVWRHLLARTFDDQVPAQARPDGGPRWFVVMDGLLRSPGSRWWDDARTSGARETRDDILSQAMGDAYDELVPKLGADPTHWRWGDLHTLTVRNQSFGDSGIPPVEALFNRGPLRLGGGSSVVDATGWTATSGYAVDWVPSMRMVVDLADLDKSRWVNLTGASGHTFDRYYFDQAPVWADGGTTAMRWGAKNIRHGTIYELVLRPDN